MADASEMLAAALEQMDGIIAGNHIEHLEFKELLLKWALPWSLVTSGDP